MYSLIPIVLFSRRVWRTDLIIFSKFSKNYHQAFNYMEEQTVRLSMLRMATETSTVCQVAQDDERSLVELGEYIITKELADTSMPSLITTQSD